jgi:predicted secreted protein
MITPKSLCSRFFLPVFVVISSSLVYADALNYNVIELAAQASRQVSNDVMQATLFVEVSGAEPAPLAKQVNQQLNKAVATAKKVKDISVENGDYQSMANYQDGKQNGWRTRGEVNLQSTDFTALATLIGELQSDGMQLGNVQFSVSPALRDRIEQQLTREALKAFQQRADIVRDSLNSKALKIVTIRLDTQGSYPPPRPMYKVNAMMAMDAAAAPPAEAGNSEITVVASGSVQVE